jgi:hypothetical protein
MSGMELLLHRLLLWIYLLLLPCIGLLDIVILLDLF